MQGHTLFVRDTSVAVRVPALHDDHRVLWYGTHQRVATHPADKALQVVLRLSSRNRHYWSSPQHLVAPGTQFIWIACLDSVGRLGAILWLTICSRPCVGAIDTPIFMHVSGQASTFIAGGTIAHVAIGS